MNHYRQTERRELNGDHSLALSLVYSHIALTSTFFRPRKMGISTKWSKQRSSATENWDMGLLLVFFPEEEPTPPPSPARMLLPRSPSSSSSPSPSTPASTCSSSNCNLSSTSSFRRRSSSSNRLFAKARSTISICALLVFITLFVFTLSTFEPASTPVAAPRRFLSQTAGTRPAPVFRFANLWGGSGFSRQRGVQKQQFALQGMGTLYRRGTTAMNDLVVAHVTESATEDEVRLFLRALHRSGLMARADLVLILCSKSSSFDSVIREENDSFSQLLLRYGELNGTAVPKPTPLWSFDVTQFIRPVKSKEITGPLWGKRTRSNSNDSEREDKLTRLSYGSVVVFDAAELDPENSLAGFLDHVPLSLRRWACYQMLLGRLRRNFKHIMLVDMRSSVILGDPLVWVRSRSPESVYLLNKPNGASPRHSRKNPDKTQGHSPVNQGMIMGGSRGVRRLAAAMLTGIVWAAMQHKRRNSVAESAVLNHLAGNEYLLRNVELVRAAEPPPPAEESSLAGPESYIVVIQRGNSVGALIMKQICSCGIDSSVYKNCR